ncbi:MAG: hypothetical protein IJS24_06295 [Eubacterium sp.]|nr:hypothetical protein [Eubacterium sp.]MBR0120099.1 hypothetical protein [Eubacterium sp.]
MSSAVYGYVRVSTQCQHEDRQMIAMEEMDVPKQNIYVDKQSGKDFDKAEVLYYYLCEYSNIEKP